MPFKSFKTKIRPNNKQRTLFLKHAGTARHSWNWGLAVCLKALEAKQKIPSAIELHRRLVAEVKSANAWYYEVSKCAPQQALRNLALAFSHWFKVQGRRKPRFKKKGVKDSFYLEGSISVRGNRIKLPRIGWVKCHEILPSTAPKNVTVSQRAGEWYISFKVEFEPQITTKQRDVVGVDVGVNSLATCSDGTVFENARAYRKAKRRLAHLQRAVSRKTKGSKNRVKAVKKVSKLHKRISDIRKNALHQVTSYLAKNHSQIVIEDLNVSGMLKNHKLASAIADCGFYEFRRQLEYKANWYGSEVLTANRFYPSSQLCSSCGNRQKMPLKERTYQCGCGLLLDRDLNAAINLEKTASSAGFACGGSYQPMASAVGSH